MKLNGVWHELIGWYGTVAILAAFALVSFEVLKATSIWYQILNCTGAIGIIYISFREKSWQPGVLNVFWALIALVAIIRII